HVGNGSPVSDSKMVESVAEHFHKFSYHPHIPKQSGDGKNHISSGTTLRDPACELKPNHLRTGEVYRLPQHGGFCFYSPHAPTQDADPIHHGSMGIKTNQTIGKGVPVTHDDPLRQIFQVHLVANSHSRGYNGKVIQSFLPPL